MNERKLEVPSFQLLEVGLIDEKKHKEALNISFENVNQVIEFISGRSKKDILIKYNDFQLRQESLDCIQKIEEQLKKINDDQIKIDRDISNFKSNVEKRKEKYSKKMEDLTKKAGASENEIPTKELDNLKNQFEMSQKDLTKDLVKQMFSGLSSQSIAIEVNTANTVISLMRGIDDSTPEIIEIYLSTYENFMYKIVNFDTLKIEEKFCEIHLKNSQDLLNKLLSLKEIDKISYDRLSYLIPLLKWAAIASEYALIQQKVKNYSSYLKKMEFKRLKTLKKTQFIETIKDAKLELPDHNITDMFQNLSNSFMNIKKEKLIQIKEAKNEAIKENDIYFTSFNSLMQVEYSNIQNNLSSGKKFQTLIIPIKIVYGN